MTTLKALASTIAAAVLLAAPAYAVTVENTSDKEFKIGIDYGTSEEVKDVGAKKSAQFECADGCGVTGPWGYSWMAQGDDRLSSNGQSQIVVDEAGTAEGAGSGTSGTSSEAGDQ
jgi:hypothetical protein